MDQTPSQSQIQLTLRQLERQKRQIETKKEAMKRGLPHLYGWGWYTWAWDFFHSTNRMNLLCAANQISKSSTQIRKAIHWATCPQLWPKLWSHRPGHKPTQFWYLYPDKDTATREWKHKWVPEFMPCYEYKDHQIYGWKEEYEAKKIKAVHFNTGVSIYFRTYAQDAQNLQSGSCDAIFCDEELPELLYDELKARLFGTRGFFHMVFTATLNQDFWKRAIEGTGASELFPHAFKQQVSMRQCITYRDGSPGRFTEEEIQEIEAGCRSETERQRRVDGRFVQEQGRKYPEFDSARHYTAPFKIPTKWNKFCAVDIGGGGPTAHPPAICFVAAAPDYRKAVVYQGWKGDDGAHYTAGDIFNKFIEMKGTQNFVTQHFDQNAKDFGVIANRAGEPFLPSQKDHTLGEDVINSLFKKDMMHLFADDPELEKLGGELSNIMKDTPKRIAKDDFADAFRYTVTSIPWDWEYLRGLPTRDEVVAEKSKPLTEKEYQIMEIQMRRGEYVDPRYKDNEGWSELESELDEWNAAYG